MRTVAAVAAILIGLAVLGAIAGPAWDPAPYTERVTPTSLSTVVGGQRLGLEAGRIHPPGTFEVRETVVDIALDGYEITALLREPIGAGDGLAGMVFIHGAGTGRWTEAFLAQGEQIASAGIVTLVPDKRLDNYSTWHRDYEEMAVDYQHSVEFLRTVASVDPALVGLYSESEGTWITPVMQYNDPEIAFTILVSAPVVEPRRQAAFAVDNFLRNTYVPFQVFRAIPRALGMHLPDGMLDYGDFDVTPWLERQSAPMFIAYGAADPSMPIVQGTRILLASLAVGGYESPATVRFYPYADHGVRVDGVVVPELSRDIAAWVGGLPYTAHAEPRIAGAEPEQLFEAIAVQRPAWWANGRVMLGTVLGGVGLLLLGPLVWGATSLLRRLATAGRGEAREPNPQARMAPRVRPLLLVLGLGPVVTLAALFAYLIAVGTLAMNYETNTLVVQGGWIGVRLLGMIPVVAIALLIGRYQDVRAARRAGDDTLEMVKGWPAHVTLWSTIVGSSLLLLWLTYWGVFQLGI